MHFSKYSSTGNDFIIFDSADLNQSELTKALVSSLCHRQKGIGADGILIIEKSKKDSLDFQMTYLNADGNEVAMCGNGARASAHYAVWKFGLSEKTPLSFKTLNGVYSAIVNEDYVSLSMTEIYDEQKIAVEDLFKAERAFYINTGVPHCVYKVENTADVDLISNGKRVRFDKRFENGVNFNVYQVLDQKKLRMRTYERGVEDETLSCGTGAVATAISYLRESGLTGDISIETPGGLLTIGLDHNLKEVTLGGDVHHVFKGEVEFSKFL